MHHANRTTADKLVVAYNEIYAALYDGTLRLSNDHIVELIDRFDGHGHLAYDYDRNVLYAFNEIRQDIVSSDREAVAFMLAYDRCVR